MSSWIGERRSRRVGDSWRIKASYDEMKMNRGCGVQVEGVELGDFEVGVGRDCSRREVQVQVQVQSASGQGFKRFWLGRTVLAALRYRS